MASNKRKVQQVLRALSELSTVTPETVVATGDGPAVPVVSRATGFVDAYGAKICEGDVIEAPWHSGRKGQVRWFNGVWMVCWEVNGSYEDTRQHHQLYQEFTDSVIVVSG